MKYIQAIAILCFVVFVARPANPLAVSAIADSLKTGASSVVRTDKTEIKVSSLEKGTEAHTRVVTVLDEQGTGDGWFGCVCDKYSGLKRFKATVYDKDGNKIREIGKSELKTTEYSPYLASDSYAYFYSLHNPVYPYTVSYEWELELKDGIASFPLFMPVEEYRQSLQHGEYAVTVPAAMGCRYKLFNIDIADAQKSATPDEITVKVYAGNMKATEKLPFSRGLRSKVPYAMFAPDRFMLDGHEGLLSSWNELGRWLYRLGYDRDRLSVETRAKIRSMTDSCASDKEKVRVIYDYLASSTRYVNISLGIGGLQPAKASDVAKWGFGDCKGLSNYMCAMLREIGIPAKYTVISTKQRDLLRDFPSHGQMNHVVAEVPLEGDTLWLECTAPSLPFGYVHSDIAGHEALEISERGGTIVRLPEYPDSLSVTGKICKAIISDNGAAEISVDEVYTLENYEWSSGYKDLPENDFSERVRKATGLTDGVVREVTFEENKTPMPSFRASYEIESRRFARKAGTRLFVPVNLFRKGSGKTVLKERKEPFVLPGKNDADTLLLTIPGNYAVESLPGKVGVHTKFMDFVSECVPDGKQIKVIQSFKMRGGEYPPDIRKELESGLNAVADAYNSRIVLKRAH